MLSPIKFSLEVTDESSDEDFESFITIPMNAMSLSELSEYEVILNVQQQQQPNQ